VSTVSKGPRTDRRWGRPSFAFVLAAGVALAGTFLGLVYVAPAPAADRAAAELDEKRRQLMRRIETSISASEDLTGKATLDRRVLLAMAKTPRHEFVPRELLPFAYEDRPLPVGYGQTVSQPSLIALIADLAEIKPDDRVLVIGAGAGYEAALVSQLAREVRLLDMLPMTLEAALERLGRLGYRNVEGRLGDGYFGWPERGAQFDAIIVRWSVDHLPTALLRQLKPGGRLVVPIGPANETQDLTRIVKTPSGDVREWRVMPVRFTTMPGGVRI